VPLLSPFPSISTFFPVTLAPLRKGPRFQAPPRPLLFLLPSFFNPPFSSRVSCAGESLLLFDSVRPMIFLSPSLALPTVVFPTTSVKCGSLEVFPVVSPFFPALLALICPDCFLDTKKTKLPGLPLPTGFPFATVGLPLCIVFIFVKWKVLSFFLVS